LSELRAAPVDGLPELGEGDRIGELVAAGAELASTDFVVVSQKAVSKAEGRVVDLAGVEPSAEARRLAEQLGKDPALVELVLSESEELLRSERGVIIARTRHGFVCANAGVDTSNVATGHAALLPEDPDRSAREIRDQIAAAAGVRPAVVVADSFGRAWRLGQADVAIGCAGLRPLDDWRGREDRGGDELEATLIAVADEAAAAADLVRDKTSGTPAVVISGLGRYVTEDDGPGAAALRRPRSEDLFG
jgi:coenzyme F420-0:L-glutamate ligase / coenzyme F420-1:gamma-L-glutamate ligase